jgi:LDH2 family malate/lactate/ureidoglycolate dehydrogenase
VGLSLEDASIITDSLLFANLRGIDSHGIIRFPFYLKRLVEGGTKKKPQIKNIREKRGSILVDGDNGMGQVIGSYSARLAIEKAKEAGISFIGVKGSSHYGAASYYTVQIAKANMIGFSITNSTNVMVAWGGAKAVIGNNPLSIAVPYQKSKPLVLDISMSKIAGGKVRLAAKNKQKIPKGWIVDHYGKDTENPEDLPNGGALLPLGEHKGYGLAFMIEVLSGVLTGAGMLRQIPFWVKDPQTPLNIGHCFAALDIESFITLNSFKKRLSWIVHEMKSSSLAEGSQKIYIPGEKEWEIEEKRRREGIPISEEVWKDLKKLSKKYKEAL